MSEFICDLYCFLFAKRFLFRFHKLLYILSLRGMGILNYKTFDQSGEANFIKHELSRIKNGIILDVGANVGKYSSFIRRNYSEYDIYAFEPHPLTYRKLVENTQYFKIKTLNVGVGLCESSLTLYDYVNDDGSPHASLYKEVIEEIHHGQAKGHQVRVISLDDFAKERNLSKVALLKIDTEGHEFEVLKGAEKLIRSNNVALIHFEFNEMNVISRVFFKDIWDFLPNYDFYRMLPDGLVSIKQYNPIFCEIFAYQDIVAKLKK